MKIEKMIFATGHEGKMREVRMILGDLGAEILSLKEAGIQAEAEENGTTFEENAVIKAKEIMEKTGALVLADDSGLSVDALYGAPGIYSARYGFDDSLDDWGRLLLLLKNMKNVPDGMRQGKFVCVITLVMPGGKVIQARGEANGEILHAATGRNGFGYDPIFYYPPLGKSFAELTPEEKNQVSHRAVALRAFYEKMKEAGYADK